MDPASLLEDLVSIPSVSGSEGPLGDHLAALLEGRGAAVRREGASLWSQWGSRGPALLLVSHLDTVPPCQGWSADPLKPCWAGERLHGLGANDAKGCVAAMLLAALGVAGEAGSLGIRLVLAFTAQEEVGGQGIRDLLPRLGPLDAAVGGEPTGLQVCTAQRGMLILRCAARGEAAHVAHAHLGENAIHKAARDIARLQALRFEPHPLLGEARFQVTQIQGGQARNQVPDACEFFVDLRSTPNLDHARVAAQVAAELESDVTVHSDRYRPVATDAAQPLVRAALEAAGVQGGVGSATASDWAFLGHLPAVKAGPGDTHRSHRPDEWISLAELRAGQAFYAGLVRAYAREVSRV
jgi:acetylornithine deacetylase